MVDADAGEERDFLAAEPGDALIVAVDRQVANVARLQAFPMGTGWFRTSDVSRVKRYVSRRTFAGSACK